MGKKSGPTPPDTIGAAKETGIQERETARDVTYADRPDQYNPFGSVTWGQESMIDPATGKRVTKWTQGQGLSPEMQKIFDQQMGAAGTQSELQTGAIERIQGEMGGAPDWAQFGEGAGLEFSPDELRQRAEDAAYGRSASRLDPQFQQREQQMEVSLRNKGLRPGDEAYDTAMGNFGRERTDAYEQARMGAVGTGRAEAGQAYQQQLGSTEFSNALRDKNIQEYLSKRKFSLGEAQALDPNANLQNMTETFAGGG
jgi:hypothetical protein